MSKLVLDKVFFFVVIGYAIAINCIDWAKGGHMTTRLTVPETGSQEVDSGLCGIFANLLEAPKGNTP